MLKEKGVILLTIVLLLTIGCASIVSKSDYPVTFSSVPEGATITITDIKSGKQIYKGKTPSIITLKAKAGFFSPARYAVTFEKPGYEPQTITINATLDGWYIGNILFGGLIGLLIVDPATGAMWKLPPTVSATLSEKATSLIINGKELKIVLLEDVPKALRSQMVEIK